ncbi:MAG: DUF402 domain-containing protein [Candidatus Methanomethylicia archaeon]
MRIRVRGIYSTALSKIFIDEGNTIVQPSEVIKRRFGIGDDMDFMPYDVDIFDRKNKMGIYVLASRGDIEAIRNIIHKYLFDAVVRLAPYSVSGVYKGVVEAVDKFRRVAYVSIKPKVFGILHLYKGFLPSIGSEILVQVDKRILGLKMPHLTTRIGLAGKYIVLFKGYGLKLSRKLGEKVSKEDIIKVCGDILPKGFGIIFRSSFKSASKDDISNEISNLLVEYDRLMELYRNSPPRSLLIEGKSLLNVEFPSISKKTLDTIRSSVTPTINLHHYFKILGGEYSRMVDEAESIVTKGLAANSILDDLNCLKNTFMNRVNLLEHVKLNGKVIFLRNIESIEFHGDKLVIVRRVKKPGVYDGLNVDKNVGDKIVMDIGLNDWYYISRYYSLDNKFLGAYININTPIEVYGDRLRYVDLDVDICIKPNGEIRVLDMDLLEKALRLNVISEGLFKFVHGLVEEIKSKVLM